VRNLRLFFHLIRWDVVRELRRRDAIANMSLFALLVLFVGQMGLGQGETTIANVGPVFFWIAILFAGSIGLSQAFAAEREGDLIAGLITAPIDPGVLYLAKVFSAWLYACVMEALLFAAYVLLFQFTPGDQLPWLLASTAAFTLAYLAPGVVLAAMTATLAGKGEIVLRIILFPLMLPVIFVTFRASETLFDANIAGGALGASMESHHYLAFILALDTIYLTVGYLIFPKVLED